MEKQPPFKPSTSPPPPLTSPSDFENLLEDFSSGDPSRINRYLPLPLLDLALQSLSRRDFPSSLKLSLLQFLEFHLPSIPLPSSPFPSLLSALRSFPEPSSLKDQLLITTTSLFISFLQSPSSPHLRSFTELLLAIINRPNFGPDRQTRSLACESLRELESAFPCLLSEILGHVWVLAQSERTHVAQSYLLLLACISRNVIIHGLLSSNSSILSILTPLLPFSIPQFFPSDQRWNLSPPSDVNLREIKKILAFLLDRPRELTPAATSALTSAIADITSALEECVPAVSALVKVNFSSLLYAHNPLLNHSVLCLYKHFAEAFNEDDISKVAYRLQLTFNDTGQKLVFRLLALHWLFGSARLTRHLAEDMTSLPHFYPLVFEPLAIKAKKLDSIAFYASEREKRGERDEVVKLFDDGLVCISSFKWLPYRSTETEVAFRAMHKMLIRVIPHNVSGLINGFGSFIQSTTFTIIENTLVDLALNHPTLIPVISDFISRCSSCETHNPLSQTFVQTLDARLVPQLSPGLSLPSYFPLLEKIAQCDRVHPKGVLELLMKQMVCLTDVHGPHWGLRSWDQGSRVLGICRVLMKNHNDSRVFLPLAHLLAFTCQSFPDLEVRDNARIHLRMLSCVPGKKLRQILSAVENQSTSSQAPHAVSLMEIASPIPSLKNPSNLSSYIHFNRLNPLLVKQSWSLSLPLSALSGFRSINNGSKPARESVMDNDINNDNELLRVVDLKAVENLRVIRTYFGSIPDFKIKIPCQLSFKPDLLRNISVTDNSPALYAIKLEFSSCSKFGKILPSRIPFLEGEVSKSNLEIVSLDQDGKNDENTSSGFAYVDIELQPEEPMPGLIDVSIKANTVNGEIISGYLKSLIIGIEDMFLKPIIPACISNEQVSIYYSDLFDALWEVSGNSVNIAREMFPLSGGKRVVAIHGTQSVKLLEVSGSTVIDAVERHLHKFVVRVVGASLVFAVRQNGIIENVILDEGCTDFDVGVNVGINKNNVDEHNALVPYLEEEDVPLQIEYVGEKIEMEKYRGGFENLRLVSKREKNMGAFHILILLPPIYHLLFVMEVGYNSTLIRIRTDYWPCLAYVDEYLEALF
ncbi:hypothetical protein LUZ60_007025 [Juncus effusus]|nr:hypothetical protein LUZ60_007025 [Juncus effusus]